MQTNLFFQDPDLVEETGLIVAHRPHQAGSALAMDRNIVRGSGGGEPHDQGVIYHGNMGFAVIGVEKADRMTWLVSEAANDRLSVGDRVRVVIDKAHRDRRRRLHTAIHLFLRSVQDNFGWVDVQEAEIHPDAINAWVTFIPKSPFGAEHLTNVDRKMRSIVLRDLPVSAVKAKSLEMASEEYGPLLRVSDPSSLSGRVRLISIDGFDLNPCSGLHHTSSNIGPYALSLSNAAEGAVRIKLSLSDSWLYWFGDDVAAS